MEFYYSKGENVQMMVALLKAHEVRYAVVSPGTTPISLVASMQQDNYFKMYSCVDERSAAYMACGIAAETGEPVAIICTEATASRNYFPGMTEAYHRKLPVIAITCLHGYNRIGHLHPQVIDRSVAPNDTMRLKVNVPFIQNKEDAWEANLKINEALLEIRHHGGGPVNINFPGGNGTEFSVKKLPAQRVIHRYDVNSSYFPEMLKGRIAIYIGSHSTWSKEETEAIEAFCKAYNAFVFSDHTSKYHGKYHINTTLIAAQSYDYELFKEIALLIHLGEEAGDAFTMKRMNGVKEVWRVSEDGVLRDPFKKLTNVFEMPEASFFKHYSRSDMVLQGKDYLSVCRENQKELHSLMPDLPFSHIYVAKRMSDKIPKNSVVHIGASNAIRAWMFFDFQDTVRVDANVGCRGIDGCISSMIGASIVNPEQLFFTFVGDLTFFYDMNSVGNRHIGPNVRILLVNNNGGHLMKHNEALAHRKLGDSNTNVFIAAAGHFGNQSPLLVRHYAEDLGFEYLSASSKEELESVADRFLLPELTEKPMLLEIFTNDEEESAAFTTILNLKADTKNIAKKYAKSMLGREGIKTLKKIIE